jgi:hypothetical protein
MTTPLGVTGNSDRGADLTFVAMDEVNGNSIVNDGHVGFVIRNSSSFSVTVQTHVGMKFDEFLEVNPLTEELAPGAYYFFGRIPPSYNQPSDGLLVTTTGPCDIAVFAIAQA